MTHNATADFEKLDTKSSVYEKLDPESRRRLNRAVVDRQPATYRAIYDHFNLHDAGVSFSAFYYYAKRLRFHADLRDIADLAPADPAENPKAVHQLLVERLIHLMIHEELSPRALERMANAYRMAAGALNQGGPNTKFARKADPRTAPASAELRKKTLALCEEIRARNQREQAELDEYLRSHGVDPDTDPAFGPHTSPQPCDNATSVVPSGEVDSLAEIDLADPASPAALDTSPNSCTKHEQEP